MKTSSANYRFNSTILNWTLKMKMILKNSTHEFLERKFIKIYNIIAIKIFNNTREFSNRII